MKILWVTNVELPMVARYRGRKSLYGGWLEQSAKILSQSEGISLAVLSMGEAYDEIMLDGVRYYGFCADAFIPKFDMLLQEFEPDIIHIWGTEYQHSYEAMCKVKEENLQERTILSIQGLVSVYWQHYYAGVPEKIYKKKTVYELVKKCSLEHMREAMKAQGAYEQTCFLLAKHCIGRTDWDLACAKQMNPEIHYYKCNETLREVFYQNEWSHEACEKHTIVFSQAHYPIKGLHNMMKALAIVKRNYPDVKLKTLGVSPFEINGIKQYLKRSTYQRYIMELVQKYDLKNHIEWVGSLDAKQMVEHYLHGNVFVCASAIENSSNSIGEAMLLGMPVVASDVGGIKSLLVHEKEGLLYQQDAPYMLADCIERIFKNPEWAMELGKSAKEKASITHDRMKNGNDLIKIYEELKQ